MNDGGVRSRIPSLPFLFIPLSYYLFFMSRSIGYVDSGLVLYNAWELNISAWVDNHNLFSLIAYISMKALNFADPFIVCNGVSMFFGALTVFFTFLLIREMTSRLSLGLLVSLTLMVSHSLSWHSTMLEVYTLNTFLMMVMLYCFYLYFRRGKLAFACAGVLAWGLGISNHILMGLFVFPIILFLLLKRKELSLADVLKGLLSFLAGFSLFLYAFVGAVIRYGSFFEAWGKNTGGDFRSLMFTTENLPFWIGNYLVFFLYQFPLPAVVLGLKGFRSFLNRKAFSLFFLTAFLVQLIWSLNYHVWDIFAFALPVYVMFSLPVAAGCESIKNKRIKKILPCILAAGIVFQAGLYMNIGRIKPVGKYVENYPMAAMVGNAFDPVEYFLVPWKRNFRRVDAYVESLFSLIPEGSVVYDNVYDYPVVYYYQRALGEGMHIEFPVIFPFWVEESDIAYWAAHVNRRILRSQEVYLSRFVWHTLKSRLKYDAVEQVIVQDDQFLYKLE